MTTLTQPLKDEHKELQPHLEHILALADDVQEGTDAELVARIGKVHGFLHDHLSQHARMEEEVLYPAVERAMGALEVTATMIRDHVEIDRLITELGRLKGQLSGGAITAEQAKALRRTLYGLYGLVRLHLAKEEEVYLPLLDTRLSPKEGRELMEAVGRSHHAA